MSQFNIPGKKANAMRFINCPPADPARFVSANMIQGASFSQDVQAAKFGGLDTTYHVDFYRVDDGLYRVCRCRQAVTEVRLVWIPSEVEAVEQHAAQTLLERDRQSGAVTCR